MTTQADVDELTREMMDRIVDSFRPLRIIFSDHARSKAQRSKATWICSS